MQVTLQQLCAVVSHARLHSTVTSDADNVVLTGLTTDSRKVMAGDLFVALRGEHFDAHDFLTDVVVRGAVAVVAEHVPADLGVPALIVPNTLLALQEIARYWRQQFSLPVIAVTGSNGKTTVKEMIASILTAYVGEEHSLATSGNLNNEIGVPLTVLRLNKAHQAAVFELGMNHPGEIAVLASVAQATVAMVNNAQREHQEFMQTVQAVAEENGTVLRQLPANGVAVFPADDTYSDLWRAYAAETGQRKIVTFGLSADADVSATYQVQSVGSDFGSELQMRIGGSDITIKLAAVGVHNVRNALAAAACCHSIGVPNEVIATGLQAFSPVNGRLQSKQAHNNARIIDDTYNANPDSVRAAIDVLAPATQSSVLVLGDMGEVGDDGVAFHEEIGHYAHERGIAQLLTLGELAQHTAQAYGAGAQHFSDVAELCSALDVAIDSNSTILIKGSRFMKMERVVAHLTKQQSIGSH
ncbi:UDP-N-acetylmuramoyl-tripeptide--D-alanyl-D-alanine ligase [Undibacterium sp. RuTC16W]|uniref:UDP-N-acetylmuramoyl-tripeptide--D-alanyl-D- alanine ligase n=1 Tax=Undibacterium sp. RuTC16W TaxID=3413048 RepID=UPI003BEF6831